LFAPYQILALREDRKSLEASPARVDYKVRRPVVSSPELHHNSSVAMKARFLSRFTPSLMTPDALEAVFVQREELLQNVLDRVRHASLNSVRQDLLLVGPRGIGKTHFISLLNYRLRAEEDLREKILIAWLREEEWGISCYRDLLVRILRALIAQSEDDTATEKVLASIYRLEPTKAELAITKLLNDSVGSRTLVILMENLDDLLQRLDSVGEMQFHRFLQYSRSCLIATSPGHIANVLPSSSPFQRGFFQVRELEELTLDDAIQLITKIARYERNTQLVSFIASPRGRARVRALRYLAGGNHRAYVVFAPLLARESLNSLIKPLMRTIDDLTPYYISRIAALPLDQCRIIEYVCESRHPVRPADVARSCFLNPEDAHLELQLLWKMGYLHFLSLKGAKYYELREPLMRLAFEVKKHRGKPVALLLDFLRLWYSPAELKQRMAKLQAKSGLQESYLPPPFQLFENEWEDPRLADCCREYNAAIQDGDYDSGLKAAEELVAIRGLRQDFFAQAFCLIRLGCFEEAVALYDQMVSLRPEDAEAWQLRAWALYWAGRYEEALASCDTSAGLDPDAGRTWSYRGSILLNLGRPHEALNSCERALKVDSTDSLAWTTRGMAFAEIGFFREALAAFSKVVELDPKSATGRVRLAAALIELNRHDEALEQAESAEEISPAEPEVWVLKGSALACLERYEESLVALEKAVSLGEDSSFVHFKRAELLLALDRWREGSAYLDNTLARFAHSDNPDAGNTKAQIRNLLPALSEASILQASIRVLLLIYQKHRVLDALGHGLTECIPHIISPTALTDADACLWRDTWHAMAEPYSEFRLPLRLLDLAVRYRKNPDLSLFMDLPQEERTVLESLVGVHVEAIA